MPTNTKPLSELSSAMLAASDAVTNAMVQALHNDGETISQSVRTKLEEKLAVLQGHIWAVQTHLQLDKRTRLIIDTMKQLRKSAE